MDEKKSFSTRVNRFLSGKGFYIVLFACIAVIGVSAWVLFFSDSAVTGDRDYEAVMAETSGAGTDPAAMTPGNGEGTETNELPEKEEQPVMEPVTGPVSEAASAPETAAGETQAETPAEAPSESEAETAEDLTFIWPVSGETVAVFSPDALVFDKTMGDWRTHDGVDLAVSAGTRVMAPAAGTVSEVRDDDLWGTTVVIDHGSGLVSLCANLASTPTVKAGDAVTMGSVIGSVGDTALCETGEEAHLHFAMYKDGKPVDPADYLPRK